MINGEGGGGGVGRDGHVQVSLEPKEQGARCLRIICGVEEGTLSGGASEALCGAELLRVPAQPFRDALLRPLLFTEPLYPL